MSNTYLLTYPDGSQVTAQGVSIATQILSFQVPPTVPQIFQFYVSQPFVPGQQPAANNYLINSFLSYQVPVYVMYPRFPGDPYCGLTINTYDQFGNLNIYNGVPGRAYTCGSLYMTPGYVTKTRCDIYITDALGNVLVIPGIIGDPCPTWTTTPIGDCLPTQIKCPSSADPRGYCCIDCNDLVGKLNALRV